MKEIHQCNFNNLECRPKMRWWLPGAFIDDNEIEKEIRDMKKAGFGGAEILYFMAIPTKEVMPESYSEYYFGSKQWNDRMKHALKTAIEVDFKLDFTVGPLWPIATPAICEENDERTSWGLHVGTIDFNGNFEGSLPIPETLEQGKLNHIVAASIARKVEANGNLYQLESGMNIIESIQLEDRKVKIELSELLKNANKEHILVEGTWTLFVYYAQQTGQKNDSSATLVVDHLSKDAALAVINYWEEVLMGDEELRTLYETNGGDLFCDSIEVNATMLGGMYDAKPLPVILWTPKFLELFQLKRGYDLAPYLPCLFIEGLYQHTSNRNLDRASKYCFQEESVNRQIQNDYYQTITELINENHIAILKQWANGHNMKLRYQIYGLTTEMTSSLHEVDVPESESLGFADCIESNLLLAGAVHMERKPVYSYELGAQHGKAFEHMWTKEKGLLWQMHQAMAGGINQVILHGMSYNSKSVIGPVEPIFKWPGLSLMGTAFSNEWGDRQPLWEHVTMMTSYISRLQWMLRQGNPKVDLAICRQEYDGVNYTMEQGISPFTRAGYSYEYISHFLLSEYSDFVTGENGQYLWNRDGAAYKALIVDYQKNREKDTLQQPFLTLSDMNNMLKLAEKGLPIFWTIGEPQFSSSYQKHDEIDRMKKIYQTLIQHPAVYVVSNNNLIQSLMNNKILPDRSPDTDSDIIHVHRSCQGMEYYYLYNQSKTKMVNETFTLLGEGKPYLLNCWNGDIQEIKQDTIDGNRVRLQLSLNPNEVATLMIGTLEGEFTTALTEDILWKEHELEEWNLSVISYHAGEQPYLTRHKELFYDHVKLIPWSQIKGLEDVSGIGIYSCKVELFDNIKRCVISLGDAIDTVKVIVNGITFIPNQITKEVEISDGIRIGENEILVEIATTLNNALLALGEKQTRQDYGLIGPVKLKYID